MAINITDQLNAATVKGKIADAKQVFLTGDDENVEEAIGKIRDNATSVEHRQEQLENSFKDVVLSGGGASTANAVVYDNKNSHLDSLNAQDAIDELDTDISNVKAVSKLYTCEASGDATDKLVLANNDYSFTEYGCFRVIMNNKNTTGGNITLSIGSTTKPLYYDGAPVSRVNTWESGETVEVYFDTVNDVFQANNVAGGGTFASGEKVKNVSIHNAITEFVEVNSIPSTLAVSKAIKEIKDLVPNTATTDNKLVDQEAMNDAITKSNAEFKGMFENLDELTKTEADDNDYAILKETDSLGNETYYKYKYSNEWKLEFKINNSSFSSEQWAAINSTISSSLVDKLKELPTTEALNQKFKDVEEKADETFATKDDVNEIKEEVHHDYAKKDGAYEGMLVGTAINLQGQDDVVNNSMYRTSGGTNSIDSGIAEIKNIQGNAVAWNQLITPKKQEQISNNGNVSCIFENYNIKIQGTSSIDSTFISSINWLIIPNHKYLVRCDNINKIEDNRYGLLIGLVKKSTKEQKILESTLIRTRKAIVFSSEKFDYLYLVNKLDAGYTANDTYSGFNLFDLTLIYGADNEPTTAEQFEADYQRWFGRTLEYEEYDAGSIRTVLATGIKTVGFNLWPYGDYVNGTWNNGSTIYNGAFRLNISDLGYKGQLCISVKSVTYNNPPDSTNKGVFKIVYKSGETSYILEEEITTKDFIVSKENKEVDYIETTQGGVRPYNVTGICISMVWSGKRDGDYEPYWEETQPLPITTLTSGGKIIFPDGLKRAGDVYDEIFVENGVTKAIKRIKSIKGSDITWAGYAKTTGDNIRILYLYQKIIEDGEFHGLNMLCDKIVAANYSNLFVTNVYNVIGGYANTGIAYAFLGDADKPDSEFVENAKKLLNECTIYYELAEPETYIIDNFTLPVAYKVDDYGTEQVLSPENGIAPVMLTRYALNAADAIRNLPNNYISAESMDDFLNKLGAVMNGTWAKTWDENKYTFSFTPNVKVTEVKDEDVQAVNTDIENK